MNTKIPLKKLAEQLAIQADVDNETALAFLKSLFMTVTESLLDGESVTIPGLGSFSATHNTDEPVRFEPDKQFSDDVNAPFAMFEPVIIPDNIDASEVDSIAQEEAATSDKDDIIKPEEEEFSRIIVSDVMIENNPGDNQPQPTDVSESKSITAVEEIVDVPEPDKFTLSETEQTQTIELNSETLSITTESETEPMELTDVVKDSAPVISSNDQAVDVINPENSIEQIVDDHTEGNNIESINSDTSDDVPTEITYIPEEEEEYVDYHYARNKSRFGLGFFLGLVLGLIIGALALVGYAFYFVKNGTTLF